MTATYTFDVFSSLDGFGSASGGDWGGYWGKQGPALLEHRLALYSERVVYPGVWNKAVVVASEDDVATMLNHALIQGRRRYPAYGAGKSGVA